MEHAPTDVRTRVVRAARTEFAAKGLAGARIDSIARGASASKERLYAYFSDKASLFQAVLDLNASEFHEAVTLDPADLPGFVGAVFDHIHANPENLRVMTWAQLEGVDYRLPAAVPSPQQKMEAIRDGQRRGLIDPGWAADELLHLLFSLAHAWAQAPLMARGAGDDPRAHRRAAVEAARRLVVPPPAAGASA
ncbi:TetR family transcriptional regulator [uncultured Arthrobacter sp.]|uniref:TetR family transcriptional regulator n=1 Tax=uncultured Arthrobacter sp. TaxID=114050 RepID=UPI002600E363|nr:TetR family transcriptional regulator [uncultured Arthrobacter sp.]